MIRNVLLVLFVFPALMASGCSLVGPKEESIDYKALEQTAAVHLTQTFEALPTSTSTFTPAPTNTPEPTATEEPDPMIYDDEEELMIERIETQYSPTPIPPTATVYFPDKADFVSALPSPNQFVPGQRFYLTWQIKNSGTSTWSGKYRFYHSDGISLADQDSYEINEVVPPGGVLTISVPATAPDAQGSYQTTWTLENPDGIPFYYQYYTAIVGEKTFITAEPRLIASATPSSLDWMCSDPERSLIQGDGCTTYCTGMILTEMTNQGRTCYANGESVKNDE